MLITDHHRFIVFSRFTEAQSQVADGLCNALDLDVFVEGELMVLSACQARGYRSKYGADELGK